MQDTALLNRDAAQIDTAALEAFRGSLGGAAIAPGDPGYDEARRIWNGAIDKHPGLIVRCSGLSDVVAAVKFAGANGLPVAVKGGGHNIAGRALCDGGLVIDLSGMRSVFVDPVARTARVQGGATLGDLDRETHAFGLAVPGGVISTTGVGGLALSSGVGWLVRKYGLTCDNTLGYELVTADGEILTVTAETNPELFWGLRGGGGNFGVVTSFLFRAYPVHTVLGGLIVYPRDQAKAMLRHFRDIMPGAPEELTAYAALMNTPDGMPACAFIVCWNGEPGEGARVIDGLGGFAEPLMKQVAPMPFPAMQSLLDFANPSGNRGYWKSRFLQTLGDEAIELVFAHAAAMPSPLDAVIVEFYGGAPGRVPASETPFTQRSAQFHVVIPAQWTDAAQDDANIAWARGLADALTPHSNVGLTHFGNDEGTDLLRAAYGDNYDRLVALKRRYDPTNFFRLNQNIVP